MTLLLTDGDENALFLWRAPLGVPRRRPAQPSRDRRERSTPPRPRGTIYGKLNSLRVASTFFIACTWKLLLINAHRRQNFTAS